MPYIREDERRWLEEKAGFIGRHAYTCGQLNFAITKVILVYLEPDPHYSDFNEVIGVLECIKAELYRRMVAPYEDEKCQANGDVYPEPES